MDSEVIELLNDVGYEKKIENEEALETFLGNWIQYSQILAWISGKLKLVAQIDESVNVLNDAGDVSHLQLELISLLKELGCPYSLIMAQGDPKFLFDTSDKRLLALHFLLNELISSRIIYAESEHSTPMEIELDESKEARLLGEILQDLHLGKPPANVTIPVIMSKTKERIGMIIEKKLKPAGIDLSPIFGGDLSIEQWKQIEELNNQFHSEYQIRREMLLKRLDVTIQSFHWSDRLADKREAMSSIFNERRSHLVPKPAVKLSDILAARTDLAIIEKTSAASVRKNTKSAINSVKIGKVPDRGGRPSEAQVPEREMPSWQQRQAGPSGSVGWTQNRGGGRGGYGGRGNRGGTEHGRGDPKRGRGGSTYNEYGGGAQAHYGTNEGWNQGGGNSYQSSDYRGGGGSGGHRGGGQQSYQPRGRGGQNSNQYDQGGYHQQDDSNYQGRGRGSGNRSRVQCGWNR